MIVCGRKKKNDLNISKAAKNLHLISSRNTNPGLRDLKQKKTFKKVHLKAKINLWT